MSHNVYCTHPPPFGAPPSLKWETFPPRPATATTCAIPLPIVPAPIMPTVLIVMRKSCIESPWRAARCSLQILEDGSNALPAADAHRHKRIAPGDTAQLMNRLYGDQRTGRPDRVAERNAGTVRVHFGRIESQFAGH